MLYTSSLREQHIQALENIFKAIYGNQKLCKRIKPRLEEYIDNLDLAEEFGTRKINRMFKDGKIPTRGDHAAMLYDFITIPTLDYLRSIRNEDKETVQIIEKIDALILSFKTKFEGGENPFTILAHDIDVSDLSVDVPPEFEGKFIGYRRSSINGDVVRFYLKIERFGSLKMPFVRFWNRYQRGNNDWSVTGGGVYTKSDVLYLFGHARDRKSKQSLGYRIQALQQIGKTGMLCGPIISMDSRGPMSARMLLIPIDKHNWTEKQNKMTEWQRIKWLISKKATLDNKKYIGEIKHNVQNCFDSGSDQDLFYYISNLTTTTLRGLPDPDDKLMKTEIELRRIAFINGFDVSDRILSLLSEGTIPRGS